MAVLTSSPRSAQVDVRGARFGAWLTTVVLAGVLLTGSGELLAAQGLVFAIGAGLGLRYAPYGLLFRWLVRPRLTSPATLEDAAPPRFAQAVGLLFAGLGVIGFAVGAPTLGLVATACALGAAFLNAAFGFCLGCELYLIFVRMTRPRPLRHDKEVIA